MSAGLLLRGSVYEQAGYLAASARHVGAKPELIAADGAMLPLLRYSDGLRRTAYGLPGPYGDLDDAAITALAGQLQDLGQEATFILSPLRGGPKLSEALLSRGAAPNGERLISVARHADGDPDEGFDRRGRRAIGTALKRGAVVEVGALEVSFGAFYRAAMTALGAAPIYFFDDDYFEAMGQLDHFVVTVSDAAGVAAAALFLTDSYDAYYHLGGRRLEPEPVAGAMSLALAEGIRHAQRSGCALTVLGGGRSDDVDDALLVFKRQLGPELLPRMSLTLGAAR